LAVGLTPMPPLSGRRTFDRLLDLAQAANNRRPLARASPYALAAHVGICVGGRVTGIPTATQSEITRHDLNHRYRLSPGQGKRSPAGRVRQALQAALYEEWADFYARQARHA